MKKGVLLIAAICFLFLSGCYEEYLLLINNESSYDVTFNLTTGYRTANYALEAGGQYSHSMLKNHSHVINSYEPGDSVILSGDGNTYTFSDIQIPKPDIFPASILNTLSKDVILSGDGVISADPITINAGQEIKTETITGLNPIFSAITTDGYPVQVDYIFDEEIYMIILR